MSLNSNILTDLGPMLFGGCKAQMVVPRDCRRVKKLLPSKMILERTTTEGDSPVSEREKSLTVFLSTAGHVESRGKLG
jgi:hypothetical protein